jgi:16S rRNA (cytosine1402-N4)-methyltransferase
LRFGLVWEQGEPVPIEGGLPEHRSEHQAPRRITRIIIPNAIAEPPSERSVFGEPARSGSPPGDTPNQHRVHATGRLRRMSSSIHTSVLPAEVMSFLAVKPGMRVIDGTLGGGGHTRLLAEAVGPTGLVIAVDRDPEAIERGARELAGMPVRFAQANYCDIPEVLDALAIDTVNGVLLDVGLSSDQLADETRGFSFDSEGPLDLRFDPTEGEPAWKLVNRMKPDNLADIIYEYGEERYSRRIARRIAAVREKQPIRSAREFAAVVRSAIPRQTPPPRIHPATRTFQALRIAVNQELKSLRIALERIPTRLAPGGRLAVISFHSLEDRLVKQAFRSPQIWDCLTRSPVEASEEELLRNPRSRSAKLRAAQLAPPASDS